MWSYRIHCIWEHLKTLNVPFASSKTRSTSFNPIHCDGIFSVKNSRCTYLRGKFSCMKIFICQDTVQKHFQIPRWDGYKNEVMKNWEQTHTRTRPKVAFCIHKILLRYGRDFFNETFLKNVVFCARVCPPLGAGD